MLYHLFYPLSTKLGVLNVLRYPSFRIIAAGFTALVIGLLLGPAFIERMRSIQYGASNVREDTPESHQKKSGKPSMGGALILFSLTISTLLFADLRNRLVWSVVAITLGFGAIGRLTGRMCHGLGLRVIGVRRRAGPVDLDYPAEVLPVGALRDLLPRATILIITLPLTAETRGLVGAEELTSKNVS